MSYDDEKLYKHENLDSNPQPVNVDKSNRVDHDFLPRPYIQLRARLAQAIINYWTILLILVLVRLSLAARNLSHNLDKGLDEINDACLNVQAAASTAVSIPHYMAVGTNALIETGITDAVAASSIVIIGLLTAVEALVLFFVNTFKSTYLCLLELAITGSIDAVVDAVEEISTFVNTTLAVVQKDLQSGVDDANDAIAKVTSAVDKVASLLGVTLALPTVDLPGIAELGTIQIPSSFNTDLETINSSINLDAVKNATDAVVEFPFEKLKTLVNGTFADYRFNASLLSVPAKAAPLTFCTNGGMQDAFDTFRHAVFLTYYIILALLIIAAILAIVPHAYLEWWQWRSLRFNSTMAGASLKAVGTKDPIDTVLVATHPLKSFLGLKLASYFSTQKSRNLARWYVSLLTHPPALLLLFLGLAGLLSCLLQYIMLSSLERASPTIAHEVTDVSALVSDSLKHASSLWADQTNSQINSTQADLNQELFSWVTTSTTAVNDTLNTFTDELVSTLNSTFGGTILYDPILKVLDCILLVKITGIEKGLTWVHDQAHISLPTVPTDVLAISKNGTDAMFTDSASAATTSDVVAFIKTIAELWRASIRTEALIAGALMALWLLIAGLGLVHWVRGGGKTVTKDPFTSCFMDDVKACISRPKAVDDNDDGDEPVVPVFDDKEWGLRVTSPPPVRRDRSSLDSMLRSMYNHSYPVTENVYEHAPSPEHLVERNVVTVQHPHQSSHGIFW